MKYTDQYKQAVICIHPNTGKKWIVPRNHRFWVEFGIDKAEANNEIEPADPIETV